MVYFMGKYFGTDGIRGEANTGVMSPAMVLKFGQAFGLMLREKYNRPKVIIGKDTRVSGYMLEGILSAGLCSVGVDVLFLGPIPTPGVAYLTRGMRATAGIMISASHNPFHDNGIKLFDKNGFKFPDADEEIIEKLMDDPNLENRLIQSASVGRAKRIEDAIGQYAVFLKERFPKALQLDGMRIVIDCANGAGYRVAPKVFSELGAEVFCINDDPNGFNINLDSGALHPEKLQDEVLKYRADIGLALDGDADRLIIADEKGTLLDGDQIIAMCAIALKQENLLVKNRVVVTVMSNVGLDIAMQENGISVIRTNVGDRHVVEEMRKQELVLGGEQSGHLLFLDSNTTGDAIVAALKVLELMKRRNKPVSELSMVMQKLPQITKNVKVQSRPPLHELTEFQRDLKKFEGLLKNVGRILVRYSGTESLARITIEGPELVQIKQYAVELEKSLIHSISAHLVQHSEIAVGTKKKG
jgi:phosphoglucosamine mutase